MDDFMPGDRVSVMADTTGDESAFAAPRGRDGVTGTVLGLSYGDTDLFLVRFDDRCGHGGDSHNWWVASRFMRRIDD